MPVSSGAPPAPTVSCEAEWNALTDEAKAQAIFAWSDFWLNRSTPAVSPRSSDAPGIVIPVQPANDESLATDGKQPPTAEERESMRDDNWKKF